MLGLPDLPATPSGGRVASHSLESHLHEALRSGDATAAKGCVAGLFLSGLSVASICDGAIRNAMRQIGELWHEDPRGILVEHRAMSICTQALEILRQMISEPANDAPVALGGAPAGDPYLLPSMMAASVLAEAGYRDMNYGPETPLELLATAAVENKACIVWLSIKLATDRPKLKREVSELAKRLGERGIKLVVGGHGVESLAFRSTKNLQVMQTMSELSAFARGMVSVKDEQNSAPADIAKAIK
ncbi:MAG: B12-binding domain-containing protein [Tepidisphaeraceae bacterium]